MLGAAEEVELRALLVLGYDFEPPPPPSKGALAEAAEAELDRFLKWVEPGAPASRGTIRTGDPAKEIVAEAAEWGADLLVLGTHRRTGPSRFLIGSVAEAVTRSALCDVLVIPIGDATSAGGASYRTQWGGLMSQALDEIGRMDGMEQAEKFLANAGSLLASSLDYEETLAGVAELAVRALADFCIIDIVEDGEVKRLQVAHADPDRAELTRELLRFPLDRGRSHMSLEALETGKPVLVPEVSDPVLEALTQGEEHRRILKALRPRSFMAVPLLARDRLLGVVLFVSSSRAYDDGDLALAERLVQLAALEVDNARLYRGAQQALLARDRVLGIVAHDLRNPLNTIVMCAELLLDESFSEAQRGKQAQMILRSAKRMNRLIQDLLDVARIEADRLSLNRESQDPWELVQEVVELNASFAHTKSLALRWEPGGDVPAIPADRDRVLQVLSNLIANAIKFTPDGGSIEVRAERVDEGVLFSVSDTGPGIAAEDLPRLFQPFWQAQGGSFGGAGLGLTIARGIVEAHGGTIRAESTPGQGSTFYFTVPAEPPPSPPGERRQGLADRRAADTIPPRPSLEGTRP